MQQYRDKLRTCAGGGTLDSDAAGEALASRWCSDGCVLAAHPAKEAAPLQKQAQSVPVRGQPLSTLSMQMSAWAHGSACTTCSRPGAGQQAAGAPHGALLAAGLWQGSRQHAACLQGSQRGGHHFQLPCGRTAEQLGGAMGLLDMVDLPTSTQVQAAACPCRYRLETVQAGPLILQRGGLRM